MLGTGKKNCWLMMGLGIFLTVVSPGLLWAAEENATPQEVIEKVKAAAAFLAEKGTDGPAAFKADLAQWVWKDSYVFVIDCQKWVNVVHPMSPKLEGQDQKMMKDTNGKLFFIEFCKAAKKPEGGWVEYMWLKPNEQQASRKISYTLQVPGQPYQVGAGIYNATISLEELDKLINK